MTDNRFDGCGNATNHSTEGPCCVETDPWADDLAESFGQELSTVYKEPAPGLDIGERAVARWLLAEARHHVAYLDGLMLEVLADRDALLNGYTQPAPVVELDVTAVERVRAVMNCHHNTRAAMDKLPTLFGDPPDITLPGALPMRITLDDNGVTVLRIGGDQ